jgi:hypothetical protein
MSLYNNLGKGYGGIEPHIIDLQSKRKTICYTPLQNILISLTNTLKH